MPELFGICIECQTKYGDSTVKSISLCPNCNRPVCGIHSHSMLVHIPDLKHTDKKIMEAKEIIERHNSVCTGHSCFPYTRAFWRKFDLEKEWKKQREKNNMDGFGYFTDDEIKNTSNKSWQKLKAN